MGMTTLQLDNDTNASLCIDNGYNHLHIACESGYDSTIKHY